MISGKLDIYVEYTGTAWLSVLRKNISPGDSIDFDELKREYQKKFNLDWIGLLGFNNTYTLAMKKKEAEKYQISTFSDLIPYSHNFIFGAEFDFFERPDAYKGLIKVYPLNFSNIRELDINLRYKAIVDDRVDVIDAFTTDAQLKALDLKILSDDRHYFPSYKAGIVVRQEIIDKYPDIEKLLNKLVGKITTTKMQELNYEVEVNRKSVKEVASTFIHRLNNE